MGKSRLGFMNIKNIFILVLLILVSYIGYKKLQEKEANNNINYSLHKFSKLGKNKLKTNDESTEYKYLLALQLKRWDVALNLLKPLAEKGDPDAMFWYAYISPTNAFSGSDLEKKFSAAADKGNPYAAMQLSKEGRYCSTYLTSYCNNKWKDKAIKILKDKEENNNATLLDQYYLRIYQGGNKENLEKKVISLIYKNAEYGHYGPLLNYIVYVMNNYSLSENQNNDIRIVIKNLVDSNYIPALNMAYIWSGKFGIDKSYIVERYSKLGGYCSVCVRYYKSKNTRSGVLNLGVYLLIENTLNKSNNIFKKYKISDIKVEKDLELMNIYLDNLGLNKLTDEELKEMKNLAVYSLNNKKIPIYINQANYSKYIY